MNRILELGIFYGRLFLMLIWLMLISLGSIPLALFRWRNTGNNYLFARVYGWGAKRIMGIQVEVEDRQLLYIRPAIYVANHQSGLDLATLGDICPPGAVVVGKKELRYIPFFGLMFEAFGNVLIDRADRSNALSGLNAAVAEMKKRNLSAWIFPEGTRNASGTGLLPFKKGAFYMAIQAQAPIIPVVCSRLEALVSFPEKYARSGKLFIKVYPPIPTVGMTNADVGTLLNKTREVMLAGVVELNRRAEEWKAALGP